MYALYKRLTSDLRTHGLKVKRTKNIFHKSENQKRVGVAVLTSDKID